MSISSYTKKVNKFAGFNILSNPLRINNRLKKIKAKRYSTERMNKSDIKEIMKFHDIGVHSFFHSNMSCETDEFFKNDIDLCSKWFEHIFCEKPYIYAFPNASYKKSNLKIAKEKGYTQILLVNNNFSNNNNNNNNSVHNRFAFHAYSEQEMIYRSLGFLRNI